jgi:ribosomal protein S8E
LIKEKFKWSHAYFSGVITKGTIIEVNISELGSCVGKYAQVTNNPKNA